MPGYRGAEGNLEKHRITIAVSPKALPDRKSFPGDDPVRWVYFGKDPLRERELEKSGGSAFARLEIARDLEETADAIRSEHVAWIDAISGEHAGETSWWFENIASRNIYSSDLFLTCCYVVLFAKLHNEDARSPALIVADSPGLAFSIASWAEKQGARVLLLGGYRKYTQRCAGIARFCLRWADFVATSCLRRITAALVRIPDPLDKPQDPATILVNTFVHDSGISEDGVFRDRYLPGLAEYFQKNNRPFMIHPVLAGFGHRFLPVFGKISRSSTDFIIEENYLKVQDYLHAWACPFGLLVRTVHAPAFHGFSLDSLLREDRLKGDIKNTLQALLVVRLALRLKERGFQAGALTGWYENQPQDRALIGALRQHYPGIRIAGAQMLVHYPNFLSMYPTPAEMNAGIVPDLVLATSRQQCGMCRVFAPSLHCQPAAALRYTHVFDTGTERKSHGNNILVLSSGILDETLEFLLMMQEVANRLGEGAKIRVQLHPDIDMSEIARQVPEIASDPRLLLVRGPLADELRHAAVVISKSSGSIVEAAARGIPVIFVANRTKLNLNPLAGVSSPLVSECYSAGEVAGAIRIILSAPEEERQQYPEWGRELRDLFFLPVNDGTLAPFLLP